MRTACAHFAAAGLIISVRLGGVLSIDAAPATRPALSADALTAIADIVHQEIASGHIPGSGSIRPPKGRHSGVTASTQPLPTNRWEPVAT